AYVLPRHRADHDSVDQTLSSFMITTSSAGHPVWAAVHAGRFLPAQPKIATARKAIDRSIVIPRLLGGHGHGSPFPLVIVHVEPAPGLPPEPSRGDEVPQKRRCAVLVVA